MYLFKENLGNHRICQIAARRSGILSSTLRVLGTVVASRGNVTIHSDGVDVSGVLTGRVVELIGSSVLLHQAALINTSGLGHESGPGATSVAHGSQGPWG